MPAMNRRTFLSGSLAGTAVSLIASPATVLGNPANSLPEGNPITRKLGKTGIELPIVSMGVMRADNPGLVRAALKAGMIHLDTAHGYMKGRNETMLGEVLKEYPRDSFVIATKVGPESPETYRAKFEESLRRLQMAYVDILYLHGASSRGDVLDEEMLETLVGLKKAGKVRHIGLSTHRNEPEVIQAAIESGVHEVVLTAINFKYERLDALRKAIADAAAAGIGVVAMKTMAGAYYDKAKTKPINCKAALKWVMQDVNITTSIPGITSYEQLEQNASLLSDLTMTDEERVSLEAGRSERGLFCPGCNECVPACRHQLPIPDLMRAYMYAYGYSSPSIAQELLTDLAIPPHACTDCTSCTVSCRKGFDVADRVRDVTRLLNVPEEFLA